MRILIAVISLILVVTLPTVHAGLGPVKNTAIETNLGFVLGALAPLASHHVIIDPTGNGQVIWPRVSINESSKAQYGLFSQAIDATNSLGDPVLIVENITSPYTRIRQSDSGNAVLYYVAETDEAIGEAWAVAYIANDGWRVPVKIPVTGGFDGISSIGGIAVFVAGETFYLAVRSSNKNFSVFRYQSDNTWQSVFKDIAAENIGLGNNKLFRFDETTLTFFNIDSAQWESAIELPDQCPFEMIYVGVGGDIFCFIPTYTDFPASLEMRLVPYKYESDTGMWSTDEAGATFTFFTTYYLMAGYRPFFVDSSNDASRIVLFSATVNDAGNTNVYTVEYDERNGWKTPQLFQTDVEDIQYVNALNAFLYSEVEFRGSANERFVVLGCAEDCKEYFARIYSSADGWSDRLPLPGLGVNRAGDCGVSDEARPVLTPARLAVNAGGDIIIANRTLVVNENTASNLPTTDVYLSTVTGDINSAISDTSCLSSVTDTNPASDVDAGDPNASSNEEARNSSDEKSSAPRSAGFFSAVSWWFILPVCIFMICIRYRYAPDLFGESNISRGYFTKL
ncbi:MAG: hypothetical protein OEZ43_17730 [Gammaproteobacteria bacterium]|nr:hypothetical protein [Gammaproteobacteria bacterium]